MTESLLIITEKDDAGKNFAKALGGETGVFEGKPYTILSLSGHIMGYPQDPKQLAYPEHVEDVGDFAKRSMTNWSHTWFDFDKKLIKPTRSNINEKRIQTIIDYLNQGYIPVIATDIDDSCEGDNIVWSILVNIGYTGKVYREFHIDETPKYILDALSKMVEVDRNDGRYQASRFRAISDYLTSQTIRVLTHYAGDRAVSLNKRLPGRLFGGRLQSSILDIIRKQSDLIASYKPSSVFESRYKHGSLMLVEKDTPTFATKEDWSAGDLPETSRVKLVHQKTGRTIPPKPLTYTDMVKSLSQAGVEIGPRIEKMIDQLNHDNVITYPRSPMHTIKPEQFEDFKAVMPQIVDLLGLPQAVFTHLEPRDTHVSEEGSHGACHPGQNVPPSLQDLDDRYGQGASILYRNVAERALSMFCEDTEWIRYTYETTDTGDRSFTGSLRVVTRQGVVDSTDDNSDLSDAPLDLSQAATLYPHEVKSRKPKKVTFDFVTDELVRKNIGTEATRSQTLIQMLDNEKSSISYNSDKTLNLTLLGRISAVLMEDTFLASPDATRFMETGIKSIVDGKSDVSTLLLDFENHLAEDFKTIVGVNVDDLLMDLPDNDRIYGTWKGRDVTIRNRWGTHHFTEDECQRLFAGETITFDYEVKSGVIQISGELQEQISDKGFQYVGFVATSRSDQATGIWQGREVTIKRSWGDYQFSDDELNRLFAGEEITINYQAPGKNPTAIPGRLIEVVKDGKARVIFSRSDVYVGTWQGKPVRFKRVIGGYTLTDAECALLCNNESVPFTITTKTGKPSKVFGNLITDTWNDKKIVKVNLTFDNSSENIPCVFNGKEMSYRPCYGDYTFSPSDRRTLESGGSISFRTDFGTGLTDVSGRLGITYGDEGQEILKFMADREGYITCQWEGKIVSYPNSLMSYTFTNGEHQKLQAGGTVTFTGTTKKKTSRVSTVRLGYKEYKGKQTFGYIFVDDASPLP